MKSKDPHVVFLMETKLQVDKLDQIRRKCKMKSCIGVSANGNSGGLALLWTDDTDLQLLSYSKNHIDMLVKGCQGRER